MWSAKSKEPTHAQILQNFEASFFQFIHKICYNEAPSNEKLR